MDHEIESKDCLLIPSNELQISCVKYSNGDYDCPSEVFHSYLEI